MAFPTYFPPGYFGPTTPLPPSPTPPGSSILFTQTTLTQILAQLKSVLGDDGGVFWTDTELKRYIDEALQTWGVMSLYWKDRSVIPTVTNQKFYDLTGLVLAASTTTQDIALTIQSQLLEPDSTSTWNGTEQFDITAIEAAIERRINQFLLETGLMQTSSLQIVTAGNGRVVLDDSTLDVNLAYWIDLDDSSNPLYRGEVKGFNSYSYGWSLNGSRPLAFSLVTEPALLMQLAPRPIDNGILNLVSVEASSTISISSDTVIPLPKDLWWIIKWGAMADLLGETGMANDAVRAEYCKMRWDDGVQLAKLYPSILAASIGGVQMPIASIHDLDTNYPSWQNSSGTPTSLAMTSYNLLSTYPVSDSSLLEIELDTVVPAILPVNDTDFIQVSQDYIGLIVDYAHHLACFKEGWNEIKETKLYLDRMMQIASTHNPAIGLGDYVFDGLARKDYASA